MRRCWKLVGVSQASCRAANIFVYCTREMTQYTTVAAHIAMMAIDMHMVDRALSPFQLWLVSTSDTSIADVISYVLEEVDCGCSDHG